MHVLVVVPTYNEVENVAELLARVRKATAALDLEVLVVDDGSPDGTADAVEAIGREHGGVHVLRRTSKDGLGAAYRAGFRWGLARGFDVLMEMDADLSHDPADIPRLLAALDDGAGADAVIGSRYVPGGSIPRWAFHRRMLSRGGNVFAAVVLGLPVHDATAGFRAYRAWLLGTIDLDHIRADGYGFQIEMTWRARRAGARLAEVPIAFTDRTAGTSKMSSRIIVEAFALVLLWGVRQRGEQLLRLLRRR